MSQPNTIERLRRKKAKQEKFVVITAYDASMARICEAAGVDMILVGDSLGQAVQGHETTVPVTVDDIIYHAKAVTRGSQSVLKMLDMPFMSFYSVSQALANATRLMQAGFAEIVKVEAGAYQVDIIRALSDNGIPVCAHLGLTPQTVHKLGAYRTVGNRTDEAKRLLSEAAALTEAGADLLLLECVPAALAKQITDNSPVPVIGIGAGVDVDGQVLVINDVIGVSAHVPRFAKNFMPEAGSIIGAITAYVDAVKSGQFPEKDT
ncbi:3-methyl-2-oxobutanoate hydroxymethyltransferase [Ostreibacterium oceani]|uniref:3-methyl-2-oxobutanoate hydroxymethyltransferase n=1 Tax=Ostreibacterium oceani TaxID=2654998 RepID=A0A6N7EWE1_9GAMM|nr:3-methyl-2-oxobutanoate hydroxymethyltransferase [Ostreibacterium oceani]MPV85905.1 3-methyl-2-oxobutanoate hydroxymethyltransferase [Ostreibacterium oceani]